MDTIREKVNQSKGRKDEINPGLDSKGAVKTLYQKPKKLKQPFRGHEYGKVRTKG